MDLVAFLIAVAAGGCGLIALLGLGWWLERPLNAQVRTWLRRLRDEEERGAEGRRGRRQGSGDVGAGGGPGRS